MVYITFIIKFRWFWALIYSSGLAFQTGILTQRQSSPRNKSKPSFLSRKARFISTATFSMTAYPLICITKLQWTNTKKTQQSPFSPGLQLFRGNSTETHQRNKSQSPEKGKTVNDLWTKTQRREEKGAARDILTFAAWFSFDWEKDSHWTLDFLSSHHLPALSLAWHLLAALR